MFTLHKATRLFPVMLLSLFLLSQVAPAGGPVRQSTQADEPVPFETVAKQFFSGHDEKQYYVISKRREWRKLWKIINARLDSVPPLPEIDFENRMLIAVFQGQKPTTGYSIMITALAKAENGLKVSVKETLPGPSCGVGPALTEPYHIIQTEKINKEMRRIITFVTVQEVINCSP